MVLADQQGTEVAACLWHWLDALEHTEGVRAVRLVGQRATRVERVLVPARSHLTCSDGVTWRVDLAPLRPGELDRLVELADEAEVRAPLRCSAFVRVELAA